MGERSILIACVGNIFLGDDAFGCEVARLLAERELPQNVRVIDFGIRSFDLAYALMDGYDVTVFVDATPRGEAPGTVYLIEPDLKEVEEVAGHGEPFEAHGMNPLKVLGMVKMLGGSFNTIYVVGCEPMFTGEEGEGHMGLSAPVEASLGKAVEVVESVIRRIDSGPLTESVGVPGGCHHDSRQDGGATREPLEKAMV
jgi:hydrogenase maturation protease